MGRGGVGTGKGGMGACAIDIELQFVQFAFYGRWFLVRSHFLPFNIIKLQVMSTKSPLTCSIKCVHQSLSSFLRTEA